VQPLGSQSHDAQLLSQALAGDDVALRELYARYNSRLSVYAAKMLAVREEATDIAHDVWTRLIEQRSNPPLVNHAAGYLFTIARNLCLDKLRARRSTLDIDALRDDEHPVAASGERSHLEDIVLYALEQLSSDDRELLVMHTYLGYGYDEIAVMQSKSPEAVWTKASRARAKLRDLVRALAKREGVAIPGATNEQRR
jgi:RNA polymerase sigma-70 factor (ECF subfamily)